jgi:1,4-alpha-glucan branching enzyme
MVAVRFVYSTGIAREIFRNVRLVGSWDEAGQFSATWAAPPVPMAMERLEDGCPSYVAEVSFDPASVGGMFYWGVRLDGPLGPDLWGIPTEVQDLSSTQRHRSFLLAAEGGEERYFLSHSRRLGAQKRVDSGGAAASVELAVWAPNAKNAEVAVGLFDPVLGSQNHGYIADDGTGIDTAFGGGIFPMIRDRDNIWRSQVPSALALFHDWDHRPYMFRITRGDDSIKYRGDIYSRCQLGKGRADPGGVAYTGSYLDLDGTKSCSIVIDPETVTADFQEHVFPEITFIPEAEFWKSEFNPSRSIPQRLEDLVIYELHVGSLGYETPDRDGDFGDVLNFLDYLTDLSVNAVELLPVLQFEGADQWGYGTSHPFALEFSAGGRDQLKHVIRACHQRGIAVILDVVYNHYHLDADRAEWAYDSDDPSQDIYYWYEGRPGDYPNNPDGSGGYLDNQSTGWTPSLHEEIIRKLFGSSAIALLEEFHVDGFRVDLTQAFYQFNVRHADGQPVEAANAYGARFLREWTRSMKLVKPTCFLIAEDHSDLAFVTESPDAGGLGFDATWYSAFYHNLIGDGNYSGYARLLRGAGCGGSDPLPLDQFAGALDWTGHNKIVYHKDHDDAGNADGSARNMVIAVNHAPLIDNTRIFAEARCRVMCGLSLLSAGTPMFLMFEEIGSVQPMTYKGFRAYRDDYQQARIGSGASMFKFYQDLIRLRLHHQGLRSQLITTIYVHNENRVIAFVRTSGVDHYLIIACLNNDAFESGYSIPTSALGVARWQEVFNSDASVYGGRNVGNGGSVVESTASGIDSVLPANGFLVFQQRLTG